MSAQTAEGKAILAALGVAADALQIVYRVRGGRGSGPSVSNATLGRLGTAGLLLI
jgi:hypothetical protein